jgi:hypothetical protein
MSLAVFTILLLGLIPHLLERETTLREVVYVAGDDRPLAADFGAIGIIVVDADARLLIIRSAGNVLRFMIPPLPESPISFPTLGRHRIPDIA